MDYTIIKKKGLKSMKDIKIEKKIIYSILKIHCYIKVQLIYFQMLKLLISKI